jgi:hypothetical protein
MGIIEKAKILVGKASDVYNNMKDGFKTAINKVQGFVGSAFEVVKNGSTFVGLSYGSIDSIRSSIRGYVGAIQTEIAKINTDLSTDNALKGEIAAATKEYVKAVTDVADAYVSALLAYSDKMYEYGEAMKKNDTSLSQNVKDEATALTSSVQTYTEKY